MGKEPYTFTINQRNMKNITQKTMCQWGHFERGCSSKTNQNCAMIFAYSWIGYIVLVSFSLSAETSITKLEIPPWTTEDFYNAIDRNDSKQVQEYLADSKRATKEFLSYFLLDYALEHKRDQIAQLLVEAGAGVNTLSAVQYENEWILEEMLKRGVAPLGASLVAERGNVHMVSLLLSHGEDELSTVGAARNGQLEALKLLLENGAKPDGLELAILNEHDTVAKLLLDYSADPNEITRLSSSLYSDFDYPPKYMFEYSTPLHYAILKKSSELVHALLDAGADPNVVPRSITLLKNRGDEKAWQTILQTAHDPEWGDTNIAQLLTENGANKTIPDSDKESQLELDLYEAAENWDYDEVIRLLELGAAPTGFGSFYYDYSVRYDPKIMQAFVDAGADPNFFNEYAGGRMYTPTALTLMNGDVENFKRFIHAGADTNKGLLGWYFKIASVNGLNEAFEVLWSLGAPFSWGGILSPVSYGHVDTVEFLLAKGIRPEFLRHAVEQEHVLIVKMLLEAGADPNELDDYDDQTILELAKETDNLDIVGMLKEAGAHE